LRDLLLELVREGKNLNQIARALNQKDDFYLNEITKLKEKLTDLWGINSKGVKKIIGYSKKFSSH